MKGLLIEIIKELGEVVHIVLSLGERFEGEWARRVRLKGFRHSLSKNACSNGKAIRIFHHNHFIFSAPERNPPRFQH